MAEGAPDPRLTPARPDVAAAHLEGAVQAARYAEPRWRVVDAAAAPLSAAPDADAPLSTQLLLGERFAVYDSAGGWVWGQAARDGYVGYAPDACFAPETKAPTHRVSALQALIYPEPSIKTRPIAAAPFGALLAARPEGEAFLALDLGGYACAQHLAPADSVETDWVATAARFLGAPYLWGGRTAGGIDCSVLVQIARQAAGHDCPRDSDMQAQAPGRDVAPGREKRGDLIFWNGHVAIMLSPTRLLHATAHAMAVVIEPLAQVAARIAAQGLGAPVARRRWRG